MNSKTTAIAIGVLMTFVAIPVFAQTGGTAGTRDGTNTGANVEARMAKAKERASQEITRRIKMLNELNIRVQGMKRVSDATKSSIATQVQTEVAKLTALNTKIIGDPDFDLLRADIKSITQSYRIFMLIIPQGRIIVAADKIHTVADLETAHAGKLKIRIDEAAGKGKDVIALNASLSNMNAKISDANAQANAAVALVSALTPDMGDKAKMDANNAALKDARAKINAGMASLKAAHKDAKSIREGLKAFGRTSTTTRSTP